MGSELRWMLSLYSVPIQLLLVAYPFYEDMQGCQNRVFVLSLRIFSGNFKSSYPFYRVDMFLYELVPSAKHF
jgi:hypothetical protein